MTWISTDEAMGLTGKKKARLYQLIKANGWITRKGRKSRNGKSKTEIQLESLPAEIQERYYQSLQGSADGKGVNLLSANAAGLGHEPAAASAPRRLTPEELEEATRRREILEGIPLGKKNRAEKELAAQQLGVCVRSVERMLKAQDTDKTVGLVRKTRADRGRSRIADEKVIARIKLLYLKPHRPPISEIHREIVKDYEMSGLKPPSYSFVWEIVHSIPPDLVARYRIGEREYDDKFAYISLREKPALPRQWVDADHHPCDHNVVFPDGQIGRPWITAMQDICTNDILGLSLTKNKTVGKGSYPGTAAISVTLRQAVLENGLFDNFYVDLGRDFRSLQIRQVLADLGIKWVPTRGYHGKSKPIERWFGIMEEQLKHLPGYCGRRPEENPERQKLKPEPLDPAKLLTIDQFEEALIKWIEHFRHTESRALKGRSPVETMAEHVKNGFSVRHVQNERALDLLLMSRGNRLVRNVGIEAFSTRGRQRFFFAPELLDLVGQRVDIYWDPSNIGEIYVYTTGEEEASRFVCKATNKELMKFGASTEMLTREREIKRNQRRQSNERLDEIVKQAQYSSPMARAAAESRYEEMLQKEREKMTANAHPKRRVYKLLPKYQLAAKALAQSKRGNTRAEKQAPSPAPEARPSWDAEEPLPTLEERLNARKARERWEDAGPYPLACHTCGKEPGDNLFHCLLCLDETALPCPKCGGYRAHRYCRECLEEHNNEKHSQVEEQNG